MPDDIVIKNSNICSPSSYVNQTNTGFFFFFTQYRETGSQRFKNQIFNFQSCALDAFIDVIDGVGLCRNDMEISLQLNPRHTDRILDAFFIIYQIILRHDMNDFTARRNDNPIHIIGQSTDIFNGNFIIGVSSDRSMMYRTFDVLTCDAHVDHVDLYF